MFPSVHILFFTPLLFVFSSTLAAFPPFSLFGPLENSTLPQNQTVDVGVNQEHGIINSLNWSVIITAKYPDAAVRPLWVEGPVYLGGEGLCNTVSNFTTHLDTNQTGTYMITWNVTYSQVSDSSSNTSDSSNPSQCGPGPFTFESFVVNHTFHVGPRPLEPIVDTPFTTITSASVLTDISTAMASATSGPASNSSDPSGSGNGDDVSKAGKATIRMEWGSFVIAFFMLIFEVV